MTHLPKIDRIANELGRFKKAGCLGLVPENFGLIVGLVCDFTGLIIIWHS